jgi:predicted ATPase/DNA-binding SARP family transcriptional activator
VEFRLLGPLEVAEGGRTAHLGPPRQRAVVAMLALAAPEVVSTDHLIDGLWGEQPPKNPLAALQLYVHEVRKTLHDLGDHGRKHRDDRDGPELIERIPPGYRITVPADHTDIGRFTTLQQRARSERLSDNPVAAAATLREALALWRGPALADVREAPFAEAEAVRLDELHMLAHEDSYDVRLELGQHNALVADLEQAVIKHPMRERLWGQLMTALYRCHRQADALATYARARERLADELGIDPGQALKQLELAILRQDAALTAPQAPLPTPRAASDKARVSLAAAQLPTVAPRKPARLPRPTTPTFGREDLVAQIRDVLSDREVRSLTLTGPGGSGKSRAAVVAAAAITDDHEDQVVYLTATERTDAAQLAREVTLAVTGTDDDDALADLDTHTLVLLDNLESIADGEQLAHDLIERSAHLTILATSRLPLRLRAEHDIPVPPLQVPPVGATADEVAASPAVEMFVDRAAAVAPDFRLSDHLDDVADLTRYLDGLPLAIELAAAHARLLTPGQIRSALEGDLGLLTGHTSDLPERQQTLTATIEWSYSRLTPDARTVADRLSLFERGFTVEAVEAVCDDVPDVLGALAEIAEARLIRSVDSRVEVRFVVLGTVRAYARNRLQQHEDLDTRKVALAQHLLLQAREWADHLDGPEGATVVGRYDDTAADVNAALDWASETGRTDPAIDLATTVTDLWIAAGRLTDGLRRTRQLLEVPGLASAQLAALHVAAGKLAYHLTDWDLAAEQLRAALALPDVDPATATTARCYLGAALVVTGAGDEGAELATAALEEAERIGSYPTIAIALSVLAIERAIAGDADGERSYYERRLAVVSERGDVARLADTLNTLAEIALDDADAATACSYATEAVLIAGSALIPEARDATITLARAAAVEGDPVTTAAHLRAAFDLAEQTGQSLALAQCLRVGGCLAVLSEDPTSAVRAFAAAQHVSASPSGTDVPIEADFAARLAEARADLGEQQFGREWELGRTLPVGSVRARVDALAAGSNPPDA